MTPNTIEFHAHENTWVMRITADKRIEVNEGVDVTEAAQKVLQAMQWMLDRAYSTQEPTACLIDGKLMAYSNKPLPQEGMLYLSKPKAEQEQGEPYGILNVETGIVHKSWEGMAYYGELIEIYTTPQQRTWIGLMRGVRVEGDNVVISVKGGNDAARELCGALVQEIEK
jgi:hypothetical protein